ncbi:HXXEE domain-containing protein [Dysgonomonas sp. BGC7]|uniref:HXXEE domain-containing protein n=1 Tax=Dysgonomonas sp. BGC7 TaxID=1658008 RepID=UPI000680C8A3|nr:HXXEE domain-containing protein [Dysgonomonas sp. BGC7]MBD8387115.1 HXXEE domain-containing protein [Dysgonomonas sp. BGC7]
MSDFLYIAWLFPIIFMFHEFEEIIFFKSWIKKNKGYLSERYPKLAKRFLSHIEGLSVPAFTVAVAEEFLLLSIVTVLAVIFNWYLLWLAIFMGYFIHLLVHIVPCLIIRRYVPGICTTVLSLIYCIYSLCFIFENNLFETEQIFIWTIIGCVIVGFNLIFAHKAAFWLQKRRII